MNGSVSDFEGTLRFVVELLDQAGISHALIGGVAVGLHGYPRSTGDIDLLVDGSRREEVVERMGAAGYALIASTEEVLHFAGSVPIDMLLARRDTPAGGYPAQRLRLSPVDYLAFLDSARRMFGNRRRSPEPIHDCTL